MGKAALAIATALACAGGAGCRGEHVLGADPADAFPGPMCDCDDYLPLCVGARWDYTIRNPETGEILRDKQLEITRYVEQVADPELEDRTRLFEQVRSTPTTDKYSWLVRDAGQVLWLKDLYFKTGDGDLIKTKVYLPGRIRLDEDQAAPGATWPETYDERKTSYPAAEVSTTHHDVTWETSDQTTTPNGWTDALCEGKDDAWLGSDGTPVVAHSLYCFVRGVGKVYELTDGDADERLTSFTIPGCS